MHKMTGWRCCSIMVMGCCLHMLAVGGLAPRGVHTHVHHPKAPLAVSMQVRCAIEGTNAKNETQSTHRTFASQSKYAAVIKELSGFKFLATDYPIHDGSSLRTNRPTACQSVSSKHVVTMKRNSRE